MEKKKMTVLDFRKYKEEGRKFAYVTAYDYTMASIVDQSDVEVILVGDSLGMIMLGYQSTVGVTLDDMIHHIRPVVKGAPHTFVAGDMPFGSYQESPEQAIRSACRILAETNCDCVKLEGGIEMAPTIRRMVDVGIPVMGHIGMTPQTAMPAIAAPTGSEPSPAWGTSSSSTRADTSMLTSIAPFSSKASMR